MLLNPHKDHTPNVSSDSEDSRNDHLPEVFRGRAVRFRLRFEEGSESQRNCESEALKLDMRELPHTHHSEHRIRLSSITREILIDK